MAIAAGKKLTVEHFDVKNAFTQSKIDAVIKNNMLATVRVKERKLQSLHKTICTR